MKKRDVTRESPQEEAAMRISKGVQPLDETSSSRWLRVLIIGGATILVTLLLMVLSSLMGGFVSGEQLGAASTDAATPSTAAGAAISFSEPGDRAAGNVSRSIGDLSVPILLHLATVIPAIPLGAYVLWRRKGDFVHKILGRIWGALMLFTAVISFWIGRPGTGIAGTGLSFIHIFSVVTLVSIPLGIYHIRKGNVEAHYRAMQGPYIGLIIAGLFSFIPGRVLGNLIF